MRYTAENELKIGALVGHVGWEIGSGVGNSNYEANGVQLVDHFRAEFRIVVTSELNPQCAHRHRVLVNKEQAK